MVKVSIVHEFFLWDVGTRVENEDVVSVFTLQAHNSGQTIENKQHIPFNKMTLNCAFCKEETGRPSQTDNREVCLPVDRK